MLLRLEFQQDGIKSWARKGKFFGVDNFGVSADAQHVYDYFGLNVETIVNDINEELK